jgi:hypothetical protein
MTDGCICQTAYEMTAEEWKAKHRDFKGSEVIDGKRVRSALRYCPKHGTMSSAVTIIKKGAQ